MPCIGKSVVSVRANSRRTTASRSSSLTTRLSPTPTEEPEIRHHVDFFLSAPGHYPSEPFHPQSAAQVDLFRRPNVAEHDQEPRAATAFRVSLPRTRPSLLPFPAPLSCSPFLLPFPAPLSCTPIPTSTSPHLTSCQVDAPLTTPTPLRHPRLTASKRAKAVSVQPTTWSSVLTIRRVLATLSRSSKTVQLSRRTPAPNIGHP